MRVDVWRMNFPFKMVPFSGDICSFSGSDVAGIFLGFFVGCHSWFLFGGRSCVLYIDRTSFTRTSTFPLATLGVCLLEVDIDPVLGACFKKALLPAPS